MPSKKLHIPATLEFLFYPYFRNQYFRNRGYERKDNKKVLTTNTFIDCFKLFYLFIH